MDFFFRFQQFPFQFCTAVLQFTNRAYTSFNGFDEEDCIVRDRNGQVASEAVLEFKTFPTGVSEAKVEQRGVIYRLGRVYLDTHAMLREPGLEPLDEECDDQGGNEGEKNAENEIFTHNYWNSKLYVAQEAFSSLTTFKLLLLTRMACVTQ